MSLAIHYRSFHPDERRLQDLADDRGQYDDEYLQYLAALLESAKEYGIGCYVVSIVVVLPRLS